MQSDEEKAVGQDGLAAMPGLRHAQEGCRQHSPASSVVYAFATGAEVAYHRGADVAALP